MNANELTFGVEIECLIPNNVITDIDLNIGDHGRGNPVLELPVGWTAQHDSSLHGAECVGVEFVSPILRGVDGLKQIKAVMAQLHQWNVRVNSSCGFHVHVGFASNDLRNLRKLVHLSAHYQPAIFAATGTKNRERGNYCKPIKDDYRNINFHVSSARGIRDSNAGDRYHMLNLTNLIYGHKPTVEFRAFSGTLNADKAFAYVRICLSLVERAINVNKTAKWDPEASKWAPTKGAGQNEVMRFAYTMGWLGTWRKQPFGNVIDPELPTLSESAGVLLEMAKKYDSEV